MVGNIVYLTSLLKYGELNNAAGSATKFNCIILSVQSVTRSSELKGYEQRAVVSKVALREFSALICYRQNGAFEGVGIGELSGGYAKVFGERLASSSMFSRFVTSGDREQDLCRNLAKCT